VLTVVDGDADTLAPLDEVSPHLAFLKVEAV
jgi:hypothetical protein